MQPRSVSAGRTKGKKCIIVHLHVPEICRSMALHRRELAQKPTCKIDEMNALVDQFATPGKFGIGAPFTVITFAASVAIAGAEKHQRTKRASIEQGTCFL